MHGLLSTRVMCAGAQARVTGNLSVSFFDAEAGSSAIKATYVASRSSPQVGGGADDGREGVKGGGGASTHSALWMQIVLANRLLACGQPAPAPCAQL